MEIRPPRTATDERIAALVTERIPNGATIQTGIGSISNAILSALSALRFRRAHRTAAEALQRVPVASPDVAVLDVRLPDGTGIEGCRDLRSLLPALKCLMLTSFNDGEALFGAIMAGASGYVLKEVRGSDLVESVRRVASGQSLLDPLVAAGCWNGCATHHETG